MEKILEQTDTREPYDAPSLSDGKSLEQVVLFTATINPDSGVVGGGGG